MSQLQGCQICLGVTHIPKWGKYTKLVQKLPIGHAIYQFEVKCSKWTLNIPKFSFPRPSKYTKVMIAGMKIYKLASSWWV
jgi:hypothetical protein